MYKSWNGDDLHICKVEITGIGVPGGEWKGGVPNRLVLPASSLAFMSDTTGLGYESVSRSILPYSIFCFAHADLDFGCARSMHSGPPNLKWLKSFSGCTISLGWEPIFSHQKIYNRHHNASSSQIELLQEVALHETTYLLLLTPFYNSWIFIRIQGLVQNTTLNQAGSTCWPWFLLLNFGNFYCKQCTYFISKRNSLMHLGRGAYVSVNLVWREAHLMRFIREHRRRWRIIVRIWESLKDIVTLELTGFGTRRRPL